MLPTKLVFLLLISTILTVSSSVEDDLQNKKEDFFCKAFCKHFLEDGEDIYQRCMSACPPTKQEIMAMEQLQVDDVANEEDLKTKCNRKCTSYAVNGRCMSQCFKSMIANEAICESSCSVLQEKPLIVRCIKVCHETSPGALDMLLLKK